MGEKHKIKIKLSMISFILLLLIIIILGYFISLLYKRKQFELDSKNKYTIITDLKWMTMQNDGGSHRSVYYQIDLDNNIIRKVQEDYHANLGNSPNVKRSILYIKKIDAAIQNDMKALLNEVLTKEDIIDANHYKCFTILNLNTKKDIFNTETIEDIHTILRRIDDLES